MPEMTLDMAFELAFQHHRAGRIDPAMEIYQRILQVFPNHSDSLHFMGVILTQKGLFREGERLIRQSLALKPENPAAYSNLGNSLQALGRTDEAIECILHSIRMSPEIPENYNNLGNAYRDKGLNDEARRAYARAIELRPSYAEAHNNLGAACQDCGLHDQAIESYLRAIDINPDIAAAYNNMGNAYKDQGRLKDAIDSFRLAILKKPDYIDAYSDLILAIQYDQDYDDAMILKELKVWSDAIARPLFSRIQPHHNDRNSERPLKVGFVSPDFRMHPVGRLMIPLLERLDPSQIESHCFYYHSAFDGITEICKKLSRKWFDVQGWTNDEIAQIIREERIDILVDLTSHTASNKLPLFAQKPAPVQATWLAYCGTTGLETIDYRISDPLLDPPDSDLSRYVEKTEYVSSYWCYPEHKGVSDPGPLPYLRNGFITFGCLNNFCKISPKTTRAWRQLLAKFPQSRLLLFGFEGSGRDIFTRAIAGDGVAPSRIDFFKRGGFVEYMDHYREIDISLDPFPFNGGTTSCDSLWMGVPVVSLVGKRAVNRAGLTVLTQIGMPELAASSIDEYIQIAINLAQNPQRLSDIRVSLRHRMTHSPLMNSQRFARDMENAFRRMWRRWCAG